MRHLLGIVEESIARLGIEPESARGERLGSWILKKGEAKIFLDIMSHDGKNPSLFQIMAPLMEWPQTNEANVGKELLARNHELVEAAFTLHQGTIFLKVIRKTAGMDVNEALTMISQIGVYAEKMNDWLQGLSNYRTPIGFKAFIRPEDGQSPE